jgi:dTDP-4-amino-4,6-dideoxygalactose transaminase
MDPARLADACTPKTRGILAVHLYGRLADMKAISAFAKARGLLVFEDAAQSHGAFLDERRETRDERSRQQVNQQPSAKPH